MEAAAVGEYLDTFAPTFCLGEVGGVGKCPEISGETEADADVAFEVVFEKYDAFGFGDFEVEYDILSLVNSNRDGFFDVGYN